jgi:tetratricopeptide (TPR) repeat protein
MKSKSTLNFLLAAVMLLGIVAAVSAQMKSKETIAKETRQYLSEGSAAFLARDFQRAIVFYGKAIELEKKTPTLSQNIWRVAVDNLGMSYGVTGNNQKAKEVFQYGLSKDAKYPMFHYNLACSQAELRDLDGAIASLKQAYAFKSNMIPGERLPNPARDSSFARFLSNDKFRKALEEIRLTAK